VNPRRMEFSRVFTLRERRIIDIDIFWDHAEALDARRLREQAARLSFASMYNAG
jgi:hypothetical protein